MLQQKVVKTTGSRTGTELHVQIILGSGRHRGNAWGRGQRKNMHAEAPLRDIKRSPVPQREL